MLLFGVLEWWSTGVMEKEEKGNNTAIAQLSITPILQYSIYPSVK
jgi:hypothetical protein